LAASLAFYLGAYLAFRFSHPPQYEGVQLHFAWKVFFGALLRLSLTIGPLLHVFVNTTGVLDAVHTMWHTSPWQALAEVASWPNAAAGLLCGGGLAWATLANTWTVAPRRLFLTLGIGAGVIFLPNVLPSVTPRYQVFAYHTIKVYIYSFHSFLVICAVLGATVVLLPRTLRWGRPATFLWVGLTASIFTGTSVLTTYANRQLAARQFRAHETWKAFQVLLREPDWQAQPPATIVCDEVTDKAPLQWIPTYFADNGASVVFVPVSSADWTRLLQEKPGHAFIFGGTRETASDGLWFWLLPVSGLTNRGEPEGRRLISWRFEAADANSDEWLPTGRKSSLTAPAAFRREMTFPKPVRLAEALRAVAPGNPIR
jgi:hypothetical protein